MQPNFYSVIPAEIRYNKKITDGAKILYSEIAAMSNQKGYCWATNRYFSDLFGICKNTVGNRIKNLSDEGHIKVEYIYGKNKQVIERRIYLITKVHKKMYSDSKDDLSESDTPPPKNCDTPPQKNCGDNNTSNNNTSNNNYISEPSDNQKDTTSKNHIPTENEKVSLTKEHFNKAENLWSTIEKVSFFNPPKNRRKVIVMLAKLFTEYTDIEIAKTIKDFVCSDYARKNPDKLSPLFILNKKTFDINYERSRLLPD